MTKTIPRHVAIIPDGNRRYAKEALLEIVEGHRRGADVVTGIVVDAKNLGVKVLTLYTFSTENWKRSLYEVDHSLRLLNEMLIRECGNMQKEGIALKTIGDLSRFPEYLLKTLSEVIEATKGGKNIEFVLALNYGGRDEIRRAFSKILQKIEVGALSKEEITEETISQHLDTSVYGDPDLIIRTSGEMRTSNFLLWQNSYSEWVVIPKFWPLFTQEDLVFAFNEYAKRDQRKGGGN